MLLNGRIGALVLHGNGLFAIWGSWAQSCQGRHGPFKKVVLGLVWQRLLPWRYEGRLSPNQMLAWMGEEQLVA
jgi:hypothetical protein